MRPSKSLELSVADAAEDGGGSWGPLVVNDTHAWGPKAGWAVSAVVDPEIEDTQLVPESPEPCESTLVDSAVPVRLSSQVHEGSGVFSQ